MIDPNDPPQVQVEKQAKIINALIRRASRQKDVGPSAYRAFQSAIDLQQKVAAQTLELESARYERERTRKTLAEALASMEEGLALFSDGALNICNDLFKGLLPDISEKIVPGLTLAECFDLMAGSDYLVSTDRTLPNLRRALESGQHAGSVVSLVAEVARDRWYQMSAQQTSPENTVLLLTEITALVRHNRREKEHLIDRQADYLQAVFQNMTAGVCTFSAAGEVMMQNGRFRDILGVPLTVLQPGTPLQELLDFMRARALITEDAPLRVDAWREELKKKGSLTTRVSHGADRVLDVQANVLPDGGFLVELKDVTLETRSTEVLENRVMERTAELTRANASLTEQYEEKARVEEELRVAKERAEAAVSSKTRFLAAASHDLLQPINAAKLLISSLQETTRETRFSPMVDRLEGAFASAEYLLHSLLDISRLESADPDTVSATDVSLQGLMEGVRADQSLLAAQKSVRLDVVPCTLVVHSDPVYLLRSIQNLVVNAIQYTDPGGRVLLGCRRKGAKVVLEVWDTGIGISARDQLRIFDEFTRAENVPIGSGVGLGLSVVDRACRLLDHALAVRSKPDRGSVFSIEMDVVDPETAQPVPQGPVEDTFDGTLEYIVMVIENDADVLYGATQWLELRGASVLPARSTKEALAHITDLGMPPDIILADYQLDGTDTGVQATQDIRATTGTRVPAILITADRSETVRRLGLQNDMSVLTKPAELSRLRPLIDWKIRGHSEAADTDKSRR
ncbi:PAS-domain containing protein [uncultured Roseobacter sp.]|uniref:hybrid sensor histidine kinase/response regulator n=1 Tax=uncultured Roseobacter sp. TaxID=114847 RepID=UPI0026090810|nr:PAS-domain containing protein [uncultured Roseobacter sp.]